MKINSLDKLKKIRNEYQKNVCLRVNSTDSENSDIRIEILIGMATCGISAGAKDTFNAFQEELAKQGVNDAKVVSVGCIGYCHSEPTVQVNIRGREPVLYGNVKKEEVQEIVQKHIKGGNPIEALTLAINFERA